MKATAVAHAAQKAAALALTLCTVQKRGGEERGREEEEWKSITRMREVRGGREKKKMKVLERKRRTFERIRINLG